MSHALHIILDAKSPASQRRYMGGKAANLHRLTTNDVQVPAWVCVSSHVCAEAFAERRQYLDCCLNGIDYDNPASVRQASYDLQKLIGQIPIAQECRLAVEQALKTLGADYYAVRSSSLAEDSAQGSFAGQFDSFLYVTRAEVMRCIRGCWASAFNAGNLVYTHRLGLDATPRPVAVVIQAMLDSAAAGVMFMANPDGSDHEIVVVSGYGLGEGVVSDKVATDTCVYDRQCRTWRCDVGTKRQYVGLDSTRGAGTCLTDVAESRQQAPVLTDGQLETLRRQGESIQGLYEEYQDIEWAFDTAGDLYITQSRPITTIDCGQQTIFDNSNIVESYPGITAPLTVSHIRHAYEVIFRNALLRLGVPEKRIRRNDHVFRNLLGYIDGRVYYNLTNWFCMFRLVPTVEAYLPVWEEMLGVGSHIDRPRRSWSERAREVPGVIRVWLRVLWFFLFLNAYMHRCAKQFQKVEERFRKTDLTALNNHELAALYDRLNAEVLDGSEITLINDLYAFVLTATVRRQLRKFGLDENLFGGLMAADDRLESTAPMRSLMAIAELVRRDDALSRQLQAALALFATDFRACTYAELFDNEDFVDALRHHLQRFGDRCPEELKLESACFRDDPQSLLRHLSNYVVSNVGLQEMDRRRVLARSNASQRLASALKGRPLRRLLIGATLSLARRSIRFRESSRLDRARAFGLARAIHQTLGSNLATEGQLDTPRDVFNLTVDEVLGHVTGTSVNDSLQRIVAGRQTELARYEILEPPGQLRTQGTVGSRSAPQPFHETVRPSGRMLQGTGCSAGEVTAEATLVRDPANAGDVRGKVLVAEMTDPGWVFLMAVSAGLVVEKGSLLSHTAIIGRELGIPTVVGVAGATGVIRSGQVVHVNGQTGQIGLHDGDHK